MNFTPDAGKTAYDEEMRCFLIGVGLLCVTVGQAQVSTLWTKRLGASGPQREQGRAVARVGTDTIVAGIAYGGYVGSPIRPRLWLARYNATGTRLWQITRQNALGAEANVVTLRADSAGNPCVLLYGYALEGGFRSSSEVVKFNGATGAVLWAHTVSDGLGAYMFPTSMRLDASNNVFVGGDENSNFRVRKINGANGSQMWDTTIANGTNQSNRAAEIAIDSAGNAAIVGYSLPYYCSSFSSSVAFIAKLAGTSGATQWTRTYSLANKGDQGEFVAAEGTNFVMASKSTNSANKNTVAVVKYNSAGNPVYTLNYAGTNSPNVAGLAIDGTGRPVIVGSDTNASFVGGGFFARWAANGVGAPQTFFKAGVSVGYANYAQERRILAVDSSNAPIAIFESGSPTVFTNVKLNPTTFTEAWTNYLSANPSSNTAAGIATNGTDYSVVGTRAAPTSFYPNVMVQRVTAAGVTSWSADSATAVATGFDDIAAAVARDAAGNTYTVGTSAGRILCTKHSPTGVQLWQTTFLPNAALLGDSGAKALDVIVDNQNNPILACQSLGESWVVKLAAANGAKTWLRKITGDMADNNRILTFDSANNVYVVSQEGFTKMGVTKLLGGPGTIMWAASVTNAAGFESDGTAVAIDAASNPIVVGYRRGSSGGCPSPADNYALLTAKFNTTSGAVLWSNVYTPSPAGYVNPGSVGIDGSGNVIVNGSIPGTAPVFARLVTLKLNGSTGAQLWSAIYSPAGFTYGLASDIVVSKTTNQISTVGTIYDGVGQDVAVIRYGPNGGTPTWVHRLRSLASVYPIQVGRAVGNANNDVYLAGYEQTASSLPTMFTYRVNTAGTFGWRQNYKGFTNGTDIGVDVIYHQASKQIVTVGPSMGSGSAYDSVVIRYQEP